MSAVLPTFLPLAQPHESAVGPPPRTPLSATQTQALEVLIAHFNTVLLPHTLAELKGSRVKLGPAKGYSGLGWFTASKDTVAPDAAAFTALGDVERCFWSREAFERVFRATNWRADDARERAEEIAVWRRDYGVETLSADEIEPEHASGKQVIRGFSLQSQPVLLMMPHLKNTPQSDAQIRFTVWSLERAIDLMPPTIPATESIIIGMDLSQTAPDGSTVERAPPFQIKQALDIVQSYYCERLGHAILVRPPALFALFYKIISVFIDEKTKSKISWGDTHARRLVPAEQLQQYVFLGDDASKLDHTIYFPEFVKLCAVRKAASLANWRQYGGGMCGLSEEVIRGARVPNDVQ